MAARWKNVTLGEYGWRGRLQAIQDGNPQDISSYDTTEFIFTPPVGEPFARAAEFATDGTDGMLQYVIAEDDITVRGYWKVMAHIARTSPKANHYTDSVRFHVS